MAVLAFLGYILIINILGFVQMYIDKKYAIKHKRRISEKHLMITAFIGGAFGTWISMYLNRHKTAKMKFKIGIPLAFFLNIFMYYKVYENIVLKIL